MAIYQYSSGSLIDCVHVRMNDTHGIRAYLYAAPSMAADQRASLQQRLAQQGWDVLPIEHEGKPALEVRGFRRATEITDLLQQQHLTTGTPTRTPHSEDRPTLKERLNALTLRIAGYSYNVGDVAFMTYATKELSVYKTKLAQATSNVEKLKFKEDIAGSKLKIGAGIGYAIGGIVLSFFASRDQSREQIHKATGDLKQFASRESLVLDDTSAAVQNTRPEPLTLTQRLGRFMGRYPSEILNTVYTGVGLLMLGASYKHFAAPRKISETMKQFRERRSSEMWDMGLGAITTASALTGLLVKEKKPEEGAEPRHGLGGVIDWIREKPLRATGIGYMVATGFHAKGTYDKWRSNDELVRDTIKGRAVFVGSNIFSELLMGISSKGHGSGVISDDSIEQTIIATAADIIIRQPEARQANLIQQLSGYLSMPDMLNRQSDTIAEELATAIEGLKKNPWQQAVAAPKSEPSAPHHAPTHRVTAITNDNTITAAPAHKIA